MARKTFEQSLERLEQITRRLESGELPLEESLRLFEEGMELCEFCNNKLDEAESKVRILLKENGQRRSVPFSGYLDDSGTGE